jgi:hypothetical protein
MASSDVVAAAAADKVGMEAACDTDCMPLATCCCSETCEDGVLAMMGSDGEPVKLMVMEGRGGDGGRGLTVQL